MQHRPRHETIRAIINILTASDQPLTRREIAEALNRCKTPHLNGIIDSLVDENILVRDVTTFHNGVQGYIYSLNPFPDRTRTG